MCERRSCKETINKLEEKIRYLEIEVRALKEGAGTFFCKICPENKAKSQKTIYVMKRHLVEKVS